MDSRSDMPYKSPTLIAYGARDSSFVSFNTLAADIFEKVVAAGSGHISLSNLRNRMR